MGSEGQVRILIVDDEASIRTTFRYALEAEGWDVQTEASGEQALQRLRSEDYDLVVLDYRLPDCNALQVLDRLRSENRELPVVVVSAHMSETAVREARKRGALRVLEKPLKPTELRDATRQVLSSN